MLCYEIKKLLIQFLTVSGQTLRDSQSSHEVLPEIFNTYNAYCSQKQFCSILTRLQQMSHLKYLYLNRNLKLLCIYLP